MSARRWFCRVGLLAVVLVAWLVSMSASAFAVPAVSTEAVSGVELSGRNIVATLNGSLEPEGIETHYYFEYGETEAYGSVIPALPGSVTSAFGVVHSQAQITGLNPYATYHFRLVATNASGTTQGAEMAFSTTGLIAPLLANILPATGVSQFAATLNGRLETGGEVTNYHFEYGTTSAYGQFAPIPDDYTPLTLEPVAIAQPIQGLQAGTTYHYRLVASSPGGTNVGSPDETFTTTSIPAPAVDTGGASSVSVGGATLTGTVDPHGWDTQYLFEYGTSTGYGQSWPSVPVEMGALEGPQPVIIDIPSPQLLPGTTYHYRLVATNGGGTSYGPDMTLTTGAYPVEAIQEPITARTLLVPSGPGKITTTEPKKKKKKTGKHRKARRRSHHKKRR
ncbi:MAG TPA: hypothetical protein VNV42_03410 [Solirubrobacteraceae bacterium]|jgi:hypothetical protein|nr:hypothetical protein [Solirubrobacteraceae bacterium]